MVDMDVAVDERMMFIVSYTRKTEDVPVTARIPMSRV